MGGDACARARASVTDARAYEPGPHVASSSEKRHETPAKMAGPRAAVSAPAMSVALPPLAPTFEKTGRVGWLVGEGLVVCEGVAVRERVCVGDAEPVGVCVGVRDCVGEREKVCERESVPLRVPVLERDCVCVGLPLGEGEGAPLDVPDGDCDGLQTALRATRRTAGKVPPPPGKASAGAPPHERPRSRDATTPSATPRPGAGVCRPLGSPSSGACQATLAPTCTVSDRFAPAGLCDAS